MPSIGPLFAASLASVVIVLIVWLVRPARRPSPTLRAIMVVSVVILFAMSAAHVLLLRT